MSSQEPDQGTRHATGGQTPHLPPMGWYPDPAGTDKERYWDGSQWTRNLRNPPEPAGKAHPGALPESLEPIRRREAGQEPGRRVVQRRPADSPEPPIAGPAAHQPRNPYDAYRSQPRPGRLDGATADGVPLAGWWWRVLSTIIDLALIWTLVSIVLRGQFDAYMTAFNGLMAEYTTPTRLYSAIANNPTLLSSAGLTRPVTTLMLGAIICQVIYQFIMLAACSASVGQLVTGLRVVEVGKGQQHRRLIWWRAAVRAVTWGVVEVLNIYLGMLTVLSYLMPLFQRRRQTIHDLAGGTQVIRLPRA